MLKKGATFKTIRVFVVILAAIIIAAVLVILRPKAERRVVEDTGRLVEVFAARAEKVQMIIEAYGTVIPREALLLVAEVRGQIFAADPTFEEGSFVTSGTRLIQIDPRTYKLEVERRNVQIKQAQAEIKRLQQEVLNLQARIKIANSDVALAKSEYFRLKKLIDRKVIAQSTLGVALPILFDYYFQPLKSEATVSICREGREEKDPPRPPPALIPPPRHLKARRTARRPNPRSRSVSMPGR